jgi:S1-C subfamily serine protease
MMTRWVAVLMMFALGVFPGRAEGPEGDDPPASREETPTEPESPEAVLETVLGLSGLPVVQVGSVKAGYVGRRIGLEEGDLIAALNGRFLRDIPDFSSFVRRVREEVYIDGTTLDLYRYDSRTGAYNLTRVVTYDMPDRDDPDWSSLGVTTSFGYVVLEVLEGGPAEQMGVLPGDFIQEINDLRVPHLGGPDALDRVVEELATQSGPEIRLRVGRWIPLGNGKSAGEFRVLRGTL